jgi:hypothetical protein
MGIFDPGEVRVPRGWTGVGDAAESCFHLLVSSLGLSIRLGMKTGGETGRGTESLTESPPDLGGELGTSVGDNVSGDAMQTEDVSDQEISGLP